MIFCKDSAEALQRAARDFTEAPQRLARDFPKILQRERAKASHSKIIPEIAVVFCALTQAGT